MTWLSWLIQYTDGAGLPTAEHGSITSRSENSSKVGAQEITRGTVGLFLSHCFFGESLSKQTIEAVIKKLLLFSYHSF